MNALQFNSVLLEISNQLTEQQLEDVKFLFRDDIGKREREQTRSGTKLFQLLAERNLLSAGNTDRLAAALREVGRPDLSDTLSHGPAPGLGEPPEEADKLNTATDVIAEKLGKNWRRLGRKLGVSDVKLESIGRRFPTELEETARETLREWRRSQGGHAHSAQLIQALRDCQLNMTADNVEEALTPDADPRR